MIKGGRPFCDYCKRELEALTEEECLSDIFGHGWTNWRDARVHCCYKCSDTMWQPPCGQCETHPCERGRECWANPPLHLFPYETYYANALGENYLSTVDLDKQPDYGGEAPNRSLVAEDLEVRRKQKLRLAGNYPGQLPIVLFAEACD